MKNQRWIANLAAAGTAVLLLTGCQSDSSVETEALKQQIAQLEQQVSALEQQVADKQEKIPEETSATAKSSVPDQIVEGEQQFQTADVNTNNSASSQAGTVINGQTTDTMEELSSMVEAFVSKAGAATPSGTASENMDQFLVLKNEEKQIDDLLERHEDELERLYREQNLTREEYKKLERELDLLEDKLDDMKDQLEYVFGIDD